MPRRAWLAVDGSTYPNLKPTICRRRPATVGFKLDRRSMNAGPHLVVLRTCSSTAIFSTESGIDSAMWPPIHGRYNRAVISPMFSSSLLASAFDNTSTNTPVEPKTKIADLASAGPVYSIALYLRPTVLDSTSQIWRVQSKMSAELTGRTLALSTVVAAELLTARLSVLLSLLEEPTEELSVLTF